MYVCICIYLMIHGFSEKPLTTANHKEKFGSFTSCPVSLKHEAVESKLPVLAESPVQPLYSVA